VNRDISCFVNRTSVSFAPHTYVCESLDAEVRVRTSDRTRSGPISCSADVLPFDFSFYLLPSQIVQYQRLKATIMAQHRFDTMLKQRPLGRPIEEPRAWWVYAISCVLARPNSRPWEDVASIVASRNRYIELVSKKNTKPQRNKGYHGGLSPKESDELLEMEDRLPIEVLVAFHTIVLRKVYAAKYQIDVSKTENHLKLLDNSKSKFKGPGIGRFRLPRLSSGKRNNKASRDSEPRINKLDSADIIESS
jgi:Vacuolar sorting-associated protein 13, N-terminal